MSYSLITIDISTNTPKSLGRKEYASLPRAGEWVEIIENGLGSVYKVAMVVHSSVGAGADIYIKHEQWTPIAVLELSTGMK